MSQERITTFLERNDIAKRAGVSQGSVERDVGLGRLRPVAKTVRGVRLYSTEDVERYVSERAARRGGGGGGADDASGS